MATMECNNNSQCRASFSLNNQNVAVLIVPSFSNNKYNNNNHSRHSRHRQATPRVLRRGILASLPVQLGFSRRLRVKCSSNSIHVLAQIA